MVGSTPTGRRLLCSNIRTDLVLLKWLYRDYRRWFHGHIDLSRDLYHSWKLGVIVISAAIRYGLIRLALFNPLIRCTEEQITHAANQQSKFLETVRGIQGIKLYNHETQRKSVYGNLMVQTFNAGIRVQKLDILYKAINGILFGVENIAVIRMGGILVLKGGFQSACYLPSWPTRDSL